MSMDIYNKIDISWYQINDLLVASLATKNEKVDNS